MVEPTSRITSTFYEVYGGYPANQDSLPRNDDSGGTRTLKPFSETITNFKDSGRDQLTWRFAGIFCRFGEREEFGIWNLEFILTDGTSITHTGSPS